MNFNVLNQFNQKHRFLDLTHSELLDTSAVETVSLNNRLINWSDYLGMVVLTKCKEKTVSLFQITSVKIWLIFAIRFRNLEISKCLWLPT
jgi:hypothetical protein